MSVFSSLPADLQKKLKTLGLSSDADLCLHLPLRYEDETRLVSVASAPLGAVVQLQVTINAVDFTEGKQRQLILSASDKSGEIRLRFLHFYASHKKTFQAGVCLRVFGEVRSGFFGTEIVHPRFRVVDADTPLPTHLTPVYPLTAGLMNHTLCRIITRAILAAEEKGELEDTLLPEDRQTLKLAGWARSLKFLHAPPPDVDQSKLECREHPAWQRVKFDEALTQQLSLRRAYVARRQHGAPMLVAENLLAGKLLSCLGFQLTNAQRRALTEILEDLQQPYPMHRLLQGDVGAGKTIVAALAACQCIEAGWQAALMAPTEILAAQHYEKLFNWLNPLGVRVLLRHGKQKKKQKDAVLAATASDAQLIIGTHALIQADMDFAKLGLAIIDEQHRFGVAQRLILRQKGENPHLLMMSATPIPRTLAMSYYADLDVTVLDELPPGRSPIQTRLVSQKRREDVIRFVQDQVMSGQQVYWVCPLIEESETLQLQTAEETYAMLKEALPMLNIALVHGRLKSAEKESVMDGFVRGKTQVLVATTVIEVGVDVPNASLMVIEHAERFGLSQLHQLRGRVGRGSAKSACLLLYAKELSSDAKLRLKIIFEHQDGFEIARQDLQLRGPGEFIGAKQSGTPLLRYADLEKDFDLIEAAKSLAEKMLERSPDAANRHLERWLGARQEWLKS